MIVEGPPLALHRAQGTRGQSVASTSSTVRVASVLPPPPIYQSITTPKRVASTVKVAKARMRMPKKGSGNPELESLSQMYVELTEATANIKKCHRSSLLKVGDRIYVSAEGIEIADSSATQGE